MSDIERMPACAKLQVLLNDWGIAAPENTAAYSSELDLELGVTKLYGAELALAEGIIGKLVVRQVQQLPDRYIAELPLDHPRRLEFEDGQMSGVLADMRVHSISPNHLLVARKSLLSMQNSSATNQAAMQTSKKFAVGRNVDTGNLLDFDASGTDIVRSLEIPEMDYSEPSTFEMVFAALKRR